MSRTEFLKLLDELLEMAPGTLAGTERLEEVGWSSIGVLMFMAVVDERFGVAVPPSQIAVCDTIDDLVKLMGPRITVDADSTGTPQ